MMINFQEKIVNKIKDEINCKAIVLFGSFARGTENEESDIDIAFLSEKPVSKKEVFNLKQELEDICNRDIDLVSLNNDIGDVFKYEILINGIILYCKDSIEFDNYKIRVFREYFELNESRQPIIDRVKKGGTIYGK